MIKHLLTCFTICIALLSLAGCHLFERIDAANQKGNHPPVGPDPFPEMPPPWSAHFSCNGAAGNFDAQLTADPTGLAYELSVHGTGAIGSGNLSFELENTLGGHAPLTPQFGLVESNGIDSIINQQYLDAYPVLAIYRSSPGQTTLSTFCDLPQMPGLSWRPDQRAARGGLAFQVTFGVNNGPLNARQLAVSGSDLIVTGAPVGIASINVADLNALQLNWSAAQMLPSFGNGFYFSVDQDAANGLAIVGDQIVTAGSEKLDLIDASSAAQAHIVQQEAISSDVVAIAAIPARQEFFVAHSGGVLTQWQIGGTASAVNEEVFSSSISSMVSQADRLYVATSDGLQRVDTSFGNFVNNSETLAVGDFTGQLASTNDYIFYYPPTGAPAAGYYVFDKHGKCVAFLNGVRPIAYAISADGKRLYVNEDGQSLRIYQITLP